MPADARAPARTMLRTKGLIMDASSLTSNASPAGYIDEVREQKCYSIAFGAESNSGMHRGSGRFKGLSAHSAILAPGAWHESCRNNLGMAARQGPRPQGAIAAVLEGDGCRHGSFRPGAILDHSARRPVGGVDGRRCDPNEPRRLAQGDDRIFRGNARRRNL